MEGHTLGGERVRIFLIMLVLIIFVPFFTYNVFGYSQITYFSIIFLPIIAFLFGYIYFLENRKKILNEQERKKIFEIGRNPKVIFYDKILILKGHLFNPNLLSLLINSSRILKYENINFFAIKNNRDLIIRDKSLIDRIGPDFLFNTTVINDLDLEEISRVKEIFRNNGIKEERN